MRLLSAALPDDVERLQGSVVRSSVQDHGRGAGSALTGDRRHASTSSSQDSARGHAIGCLLYTSPSPRDKRQSRMPSSA